MNERQFLRRSVLPACPLLCLTHNAVCVRYRTVSEWMMHIDPDEYFHFRQQAAPSFVGSEPFCMPADLPCPAVRDVFVEKTAINQRQRKGMLKAFVDLAPRGKNQIKAHHTTPTRGCHAHSQPHL